MRFIKRVYVAGVGYTCYLTKSPIKTPVSDYHPTGALIENTNKAPVTKPAAGTSGAAKTSSSNQKGTATGQSGTNVGAGKSSEVYLDHLSALRGSKKASPDKDHTYALNLKIGYSDLKVIDLTPYLTEDIEILVVGKEIITTPGYQELATEIESLITASEIKSIIIIRGENKVMVNSLAALIRNLRPYSVYKGIGLRLEGDPLILKTFVKNKHK